jgi:hypothetical protein
MPRAAGVSRISPIPLLLVSLSVACSGSDAAPAAPTGFSVTQSMASFDDVFVTWTAPPGFVDGYDAEARIGDGPWESVGSIPGDAIGGTLTFNSSAPELTRFTFRIRSVRGGKRSGWVEAQYFRALRWPTGAQSEPVREGIHLSWTNTSAAATGVRVSRHFADGWRAVADLPATAQSWTDGADLIVNQGIEYGIAATAGDVEGLPVTHYAQGYPPASVFDLTATPEAGGVRLRWVNSPVAAGHEIHRAEGLVVTYFGDLNPVTLPASATEYLDPLPGGSWTWHVVSVYPGVGSPWSQVRGVSNPIGTPALLAGLVSLPDGSEVTTDGGEKLGFAVGSTFYPPSTGPQRLVFRGTGAPPDRDLGTNHGWAAPELAFDVGGNPHSVVLRPTGGAPPVALVHVWYDGAGWNEEEIARRAISDPLAVRLALDDTGGVHVAWTTIAGGPRAEYARRASGSWSAEDLSALVPSDATLRRFDVDALGAPSLAFESGGTALLARFETAWTVETLPFVGWSIWDVRRSPAGLDVVAEDCLNQGASMNLVLLERTIAGWGAKQVIRTLGQCLPIDELRVVRPASGDRVVVWGDVAGFQEIDVRDAGTWTHVETRPAVVPTSAAWFDASSKLHVLVRSDGYSDLAGIAPYILHVEP